MKYRVGMYGGTFDPFHLGHLDCILQAASLCESLFIVMSVAKNRSEIPWKVRYRWLYTITKHLSNVSIITLTDESESKATYSQKMWDRDAKIVKDKIQQKIDIVFCGSDYDQTSFWNVCYPESELYIFQRNEINSTQIRQNPYLHWDWLPRVVQPWYVKKVLIMGGESTGKSTLTQNLALRFNTNFLEETGRDISVRSGSDKLMLDEDFTEILLRHKLREMEFVKQSRCVLFVDTDALVTEFYLSFLQQHSLENERLAQAISALNRYDLILFLMPDVPFVQDGTRNGVIEADREKYSQQLMDLLDRYHAPVQVLRGDYQTRYMTAVKLVNTLLGVCAEDQMH